MKKTARIKILSKVVIASCLVMITFFSSCRKRIDSTFEMIRVSNQTILKSTIAEDGTFGNEVIATEIKKFSQENGFDINKIEDAKIKSCKFVIQDSEVSPVDLSLFDSLEVWISTATQPAIKVGFMTQTPGAAVSSLDLDLTNTSIKEYIKAEQLNCELRGKTNQAVPHNVPVTIEIQIEFNATIFD